MRKYSAANEREICQSVVFRKVTSTLRYDWAPKSMPDIDLSPEPFGSSNKSAISAIR